MAKKTLNNSLPHPPELYKFFTQTLLRWNLDQNQRKMPWKGEKDPYKIWLSEVMLQQTRVEQGMAYYNRFVEQFPNVTALAVAKDEKVFKLWEGLGYYSRCRNLLETARYIAFECGGIFPDNYASLLKLKGVGPYTAAAIASFAFNLQHAVVDGNVFRVIARYMGIDEAIDTHKGKQVFTELANGLLDKKTPGIYNQAIMDFGATICKPALPLCSKCVLQKKCIAIKAGTVNQLPVKTKTILRKNRWMYYFIFICKNAAGIRQRIHKDIWQGLFEFYLFESEKMIHWDEAAINGWLQTQLKIKGAKIKNISSVHQQQLTHQQITGQFIQIELKSVPESLAGLDWVNSRQMQQLAFPKLITQYLEGGL